MDSQQFFAKANFAQNYALYGRKSSIRYSVKYSKWSAFTRGLYGGVKSNIRQKENNHYKPNMIMTPMGDNVIDILTPIIDK